MTLILDISYSVDLNPEFASAFEKKAFRIKFVIPLFLKDIPIFIPSLFKNIHFYEIITSSDLLLFCQMASIIECSLQGSLIMASFSFLGLLLN